MRALKALVIGMGVLIAGALALLVYGLVKQSSDPGWKLFGEDARVERPLAPVARPFGTVALPVPAHCEVTGMTAAGGVLYLQLSGDDGACNTVVGVDGQTGTVLGRLTPGGA